MNKIKLPESDENNKIEPEWMKTLENRKRKGHKLAHEIGAGSPCIKCQEKCPGLDLHFWRKICRNCKCKKEDHDVQDEDDFEQFEILLGSSKKKNKTLLAFDIKSANQESNKPLLFDWIPPNVNDDLAVEYLKQLPPSRLPISGSDGALERKRAFERQLPLHDFNAELCHNLSTAETDAQAEYLNNLRSNAVGQATVFKVGAFNTKNHLGYSLDAKMSGSQSAHCLGTLNKNPAYNSMPKPFMTSKYQNEQQESIPPPINMDSHPDNLPLKQPSHFVQSTKETSKPFNIQSETLSTETASNQQSEPMEEVRRLQRFDVNPELASSQDVIHPKGYSTLTKQRFDVHSELASSQDVIHQRGYSKPTKPFNIQNETLSSETASNQRSDTIEALRRLQRDDVNSDLANSQGLIHQKGYSMQPRDFSKHHNLQNVALSSEHGSYQENDPNEALGRLQRHDVNPELVNSQNVFGQKGYSIQPKDFSKHHNLLNESNSSELGLYHGIDPNKALSRLQRHDINPELVNSQNVLGHKGHSKQPGEFYDPYNIQNEMISSDPCPNEENEQIEALRRLQRVDTHPELINSQDVFHKKGFSQQSGPGNETPSKHQASDPYYDIRRERSPTSMARMQDLIHNRGDGSLLIQNETSPQNIRYGIQNERLISEMANSQELSHQHGRSSPLNGTQEGLQNLPNSGIQGEHISYGTQDKLASSQPISDWHQNDNNNALYPPNNNLVQHPLDSTLSRDPLYPNNIIFSNIVPTDAMPKAAHLLDQLDQLTLNEQASPESYQAHPMLAPESVEQEKVACAKCDQVLDFGDVAVFADRAGPAKVWHPACFSCAVCNELLADLIYFYYGDSVYCGRHYAEMLKIPRCHACDELIFVKEYTLAEEHAYHYKHFCCLECDQPLGGLRYVPVKDHPVCLDCYQRIYGKKCAKCQQLIAPDEKRLQIGSNTWHVNDRCFTCNTCGKNLVGQRMVCPQGIPYCSKECALQNK